jgi:outer membrane receptor protein involved in Fe transport
MFTHPGLRTLGLGALFALALPAFAAEGSAAADELPAPEIVVKGDAVRGGALGFSPFAITPADIRERRVPKIEDLLRDVPGVNVRDFGLSGVANAIAIRGFANGGHGGDLGIVLDGIPLNEANSHADGYVDLSVIVPLEVGGFTVFRGPVSALYGNFNRGGLIAIETRKRGDYAEGDLSFGSFNAADAQGAFGATFGKNQQVNAAAQFYRTDGFRPQSRLDRGTLAARYAARLSPSLDVALSGRFHAQGGSSPSYLTAVQFAADPYGIDPRVQNDGSEKRFGTARLDLNYTVAPELRLLTFLYGTRQDFTRWFTRPVSPTLWRQREESYDRRVGGAGASLNGAFGFGQRSVAFVAGIEGFSETTAFQFYDGVVNRRRVNPALNDRETTLRSVSAFAEANIPLNSRFDLSLGLRYDRFTGDCRLLGPETGSDPCGRLDDIDNLSPKAALRFKAAPWLEVRGSYAEGFALPGGFTKFAPGAQALDPNRLRQYELGARIAPAAGLEVDVVGFRLDSDDEFRTVAPGIFENFGATRRQGLEVSARYEPDERIELRAVYAYIDTAITENASPALVGRRVPGASDHTATVSAAVRPIPALRINAAWRHVGRYAVDAPNTRFSRRYDLLDLGASYDIAPERLRVFVNIENATDAAYASTEFLIAGQPLFAPGAPRSVRAGLQAGF